MIRFFALVVAVLLLGSACGPAPGGPPSERVTTRCYELGFEEGAAAQYRELEGDTLVLSDVPVGEDVALWPGRYRAFVGMEAFRSPATLDNMSLTWWKMEADSVRVAPSLFLVARVWRAEYSPDALRGTVTVATDEVGGPVPGTYAFRGRGVECGLP